MSDLPATVPTMVPAPTQNTSIEAARTTAIAEIQMQHAVARTNPRINDVVRQRLLFECVTPELAAKGIYSLPFGNEPVEGLTIRTAEAFLRARGNMLTRVDITGVFEAYEQVRVTVTDLESMQVESDETIVRREIERKNPIGRTVLSRRQKVTKNGLEDVYIVSPTDAEMGGKRQSAISKLRRNLALRFMPFDLRVEVERRIRETMQDDAAKHPEERRRAMIDDFASLGVSAADLIDVIGQPIESLSPAQLAEWRQIYTGLSESHFNWSDVVAAKSPAPAAEEAEPPQQSKMRSLLDRIKPHDSAGPIDVAASATKEAKQPAQPDPVEAGEDRGRVLDALSEWIATKRPEVNAVLTAAIQQGGKKKLGELTTQQLSAVLIELRKLDEGKK